MFSGKTWFLSFARYGFNIALYIPSKKNGKSGKKSRNVYKKFTSAIELYDHKLPKVIIPLYLSTVKFGKVGRIFQKVHRMFTNKHLTAMP